MHSKIPIPSCVSEIRICYDVRRVINKDVKNDAENMEEKYYNDEDHVHVILSKEKSFVYYGT